MTIGLADARVGQISITVKDVPRAVAFYRDVLGLRFLFDAPSMAFFDAGGVRLFLDIPEDPEFDHPSSTVYFQVPDIDATYAELGERGATFIGEPHLIARMPDHDLWMAFFRDTEGNVLALMCEKRPPAGDA
jgi:methylmalonyl-CoA/ethylmalonyl-CoA epimerase